MSDRHYRWMSPRWNRMLMWAFRLPSPSFGRTVTLREAWTGLVPWSTKS